MAIMNVHDAKTYFSRLIEQAVAGEPVIVAKAGRPVVKLVPIDSPDAGAKRRLGFLAGQGAVPDDFDRMGAGEIEAMFDGQA